MRVVKAVRKTCGPLLFCRLDERAQRFQIARVIAKLILRRLQKESGVRQRRMASNAAERFASNVAQSYVPVAINARVIVGLRVVEVNREHITQADIFFERLKRGFKPVTLAYVVARRESVCRVQTDTEA